MSISEHEDQFVGLPIQKFGVGDTIDDPSGVAYRLSLDYDDAENGGAIGPLLDRFLADPASGKVTTLVIGLCGDGGDESPEIFAPLVLASDRLSSLKALFLGDIIGEECEISWIHQDDVGPLLAAYPTLEHLRVRVGEGLSFGCERHEELRTLIVESGGLPGAVVRQILAADLPRLEHLELWLGTDNYGGDTKLADLAPLLSGERFPALRHLGLRNSKFADELAAALAHAAILGRIETLDLSLGTLSDEGAVALLEGGNLSGLRRLDIHYHYITDEVLDGLKALGLDLIDDDGQANVDEAERYIAVSE